MQSTEQAWSIESSSQFRHEIERLSRENALLKKRLIESQGPDEAARYEQRHGIRPTTERPYFEMGLVAVKSIEPTDQIFDGPFDVRPEAIREALWHGCMKAARMVRDPATDLEVCGELTK